MPSFQCVHRLNPATVACVSCIHANSKQDFLELTITSSSNSFVGGCILDVTMSEDQEVNYYSLTPKRIRTCVRAMRAVVYVYMCGLCIQGCLVSGSPLHTHVKKCEGGKERWGEPGKMSCHGGRLSSICVTTQLTLRRTGICQRLPSRVSSVFPFLPHIFCVLVQVRGRDKTSRVLFTCTPALIVYLVLVACIASIIINKAFSVRGIPQRC